MNAYERMKAMVEGKKLDRPGVALWGPHFNLEDRNVDDFTRVSIDYQNAHQFDFLKVMPNGAYFTEDFGQITRWSEVSTDDSWDNTVRFAINDPHEWDMLKVCDPKKGALAREVEVVKRLCDHYKGKVPVIFTLFGPIASAQEMAGGYFRPEVIVANIMYSEKHIRKGLEILTETTAGFMDELIKAGVDGFFYSQRMCLTSIMSVEMFREYGKKYDVELFNRVKDKTWLNILHIHGDRDLMMEELVDYPVTALNWEDQSPRNPSIAQVRAMTDKILVGGLDHTRDLIGPRDVVKEETRAKVRDAIAQAGDDKLVISGGCGWNPESTHRFAVLKEIMDEIAAERAK